MPTGFPSITQEEIPLDVAVRDLEAIGDRVIVGLIENRLDCGPLDERQLLALDLIFGVIPNGGQQPAGEGSQSRQHDNHFNHISHR
jgi:hypothetical protein